VFTDAVQKLEKLEFEKQVEKKCSRNRKHCGACFQIFDLNHCHLTRCIYSQRNGEELASDSIFMVSFPPSTTLKASFFNCLSRIIYISFEARVWVNYEQLTMFVHQICMIVNKSVCGC